MERRLRGEARGRRTIQELNTPRLGKTFFRDRVEDEKRATRRGRAGSRGRNARAGGRRREGARAHLRRGSGSAEERGACSAEGRVEVRRDGSSRRAFHTSDISPFHVTRILSSAFQLRPRPRRELPRERAADAIGRFKLLRSRARRAASLIRIRSRRSRRAAHSRPSVALALSPSRPVARTSRRSAAPPSASSRARAGWRRSRERPFVSPPPRRRAVLARSARASPCSTSSTSSRFTGRTTATR